MPFYKWVIKTQHKSESKAEDVPSDSKSENCDVCLSANKRMVNVIRHLSQLARIADDVFGAIDFECRNLIQRTSNLATRIQTFQAFVDKLDAKTVKIPVSSITGKQVPKTPFSSCDEKSLSRAFCTFPRPVEVERYLAECPPTPALLLGGQVVSEADGTFSETTHIYCKSLQIPESQNHKNNAPAEEPSDKTHKAMISSVKVPSSIMPIDVSGQTFSRMASFRRSLIHVDFFIRRKKKDKRRNTVAEGDTKELKNALQHIINEERQQKGIPNGTLLKSPITNAVDNIKLDENAFKKVTVQEANKKNNSIKEIILSENEQTLKRNSDQNKSQPIQNGSFKLDLKNSHSDAGKASLCKRKPKSHIPISTISAAMNVAVEMRQLNGVDQSSSGSSDHNLSDSDIKKPGDNNLEVDQPTLNGEDSGFSDSYKTRKSRSKGNYKPAITNAQQGNEETETISSSSSETTAVQDEDESNATSVESDAFFISSDESEEESSDIFIQKYGSSTSISTMSDGSLNSLLSQTGTEMASSTGTLTSIGFERYPTPPPPPPPFVIVASKNEIAANSSPSLTKTDKSLKHLSTKSPLKHASSSKTSKKSISPQKPRKSLSIDKNNRNRSSDNSKSIFTSLVSKKTRERDQNRPKDFDQNNSTVRTKSFFDMYGTNSPQKVPQLPTFIPEHVQPVSENKPITHLQSFLPVNSVREYGVETESKSSLTDNQPYKEVNVVNEHSPSSTANTLFKIIPPVKNIEVPLKYVQQVVVTPISRQHMDKSDKYFCRKSLFNDNNNAKQKMETEISVKPHSSQLNGRNMEIPISVNNPLRPQRPNTLQSGTKPAARVVLDPEGRVIYSTNSLDRRLPYEFPNQSLTTRNDLNDHYRCPVSPPPRNDTTSTNYNLYSRHHNCNSQGLQTPAYSSQSHYSQHVLKNSNLNTFASPKNYKDVPKLSEYPPNHPNRGRIRHSINGVIETNNGVYEIDPQSLNFPSPPEPLTHIKITPPPYEEAVSSSCSRIVIADPNISGLPTRETLLTEKNINLHLQNIERLNRLQLEPVTDSPKVLTGVPSTQANSRNQVDNNLSKLKGSTMSAEDLFAVIHDCKKRMNIKTDSDISSSSRSNSPSYLRPPTQKGNFVETGFLSPRSNFNSTRDRRSWADFRPVSCSPNERKSLASDRLGRTKPTSMHDFKMLLLQARSNTQISGPRKSAVEMLKISPSSSTSSVGHSSSPVGNSPQYPNSFSLQNSPTSPSYICNGHSTVPFKRHNSRIRSSLQSRYTMYPPIFEDCSEETENNRDTVDQSYN